MPSCRVEPTVHVCWGGGAADDAAEHHVCERSGHGACREPQLRYSVRSHSHLPAAHCASRVRHSSAVCLITTVRYLNASQELWLLRTATASCPPELLSLEPQPDPSWTPRRTHSVHTVSTHTAVPGQTNQTNPDVQQPHLQCFS